MDAGLDAGLVPIGELARRTGVAASRLRYYDELGLVTPATRDGGRRHYDERGQRRLATVLTLQRTGFTLEEIRWLLDGGQDWRQLAVAKARELDRQLAALQGARDLVRAALSCDCERLDSCGRLHHLASPTTG